MLLLLLVIFDDVSNVLFDAGVVASVSTFAGDEEMLGFGNDDEKFKVCEDGISKSSLSSNTTTVADFSDFDVVVA